MAEVQIKITGKASSRVTVKRPSENGTRPLTAVLHTTWTKPEWDAMATDDTAATQTAKTLGVEVEELRAGIATMQEQGYYAPAVYRAACGYEIYDRKDGTPKRQRIPELIMGWDGDDRAGSEEMRTDRKPREACLDCPKLRMNIRNFMVRDDYPGEVKDPLFKQRFYECRTFTLVPGAVPPPEMEPKVEATQGAR